MLGKERYIHPDFGTIIIAYILRGKIRIDYYFELFDN